MKGSLFAAARVCDQLWPVVYVHDFPGGVSEKDKGGIGDLGRGQDGGRGQKRPISVSNQILGSVSIFNRRLILKAEIVAKQISFYIAANSVVFMLLRPATARGACAALLSESNINDNNHFLFSGLF